MLKCAWEKLAWPSKKNLLSEFIDMLRRIVQLSSWSEDLVTPQCVWLPGLFNPTAYLTAVMQVQLVALSTCIKFVSICRLPYLFDYQLYRLMLLMEAPI